MENYHYNQVEEYWRKAAESGFFDIEGLRAPRGVSGLFSYTCEGLNQLGGIPYRPLVVLYARVGLQRYNMENGTNFELHCLIKFNMVPNPASAYYITLAARDTVTRRPMQTFQVQVQEHRIGYLDMTCSLARIKGETINSPLPPLPLDDNVDAFIDRRWVDWRERPLPDWPSDDDRQRFYLVEGSELVSAYWIRMYLQLAVCATHRFTPERSLCQLKIFQAAIETSDENVNERLEAKNATFYIAFTGLAIRGIGEHVERKAIIRRSFHEPTGKLSLKGVLCKGEGEGELSVKELYKLGRENLKRHLGE